MRLIVAAVAVVVAVLSCKPNKDVTLGKIERLTSNPGTLGLYSYPYYNSIYALPGGGAVTAWLRREGGFMPVVYRAAASDAAVFGAEDYLSPEPLRQTLSIVPTIVAGGDDLYAVWQARQPTRGSKFVVFARSHDRGATWSAGQPLNVGTGAFVPAIATASNGRIYVAWPDDSSSSRTVRFNRSLDGGATWLPEAVQISESGRRDVLSAAIASDGGERVLVVWDQTARGRRRIVAASSADSGTTWLPPVQVDDGEKGPSPGSPAVVFAGGTAVVAWSAGSTAISKGVVGSGQVWGDVSRDGGATWGTDVLIHETINGFLPTLQLTSDGTRAHVVFSAGPATGGARIYVSSTDQTTAWKTDSAARPVSAREGKFVHPRMAQDRRGMMFAVWEEEGRRIHFTHSTGGGTDDEPVRWSDDDEIVYEVDDPQKAEAHYPQVAAADGAVYVIWEVWDSLKGQVKTFSDLEHKARPADLYVRRITVAR